MMIQFITIRLTVEYKMWGWKAVAVLLDSRLSNRLLIKVIWLDTLTLSDWIPLIRCSFCEISSSSCASFVISRLSMSSTCESRVDNLPSRKRSYFNPLGFQPRSKIINTSIEMRELGKYAAYVWVNLAQLITVVISHQEEVVDLFRHVSDKYIKSKYFVFNMWNVLLYLLLDCNYLLAVVR